MYQPENTAFPHLVCTLAHYTLHCNTMNPNIDQITKYPELSCCSEVYLWIVAAYQPEKENPCRIRFTVGGNLID